MARQHPLTLQQAVEKTLERYRRDKKEQYTECAKAILQLINWEVGLDIDALHNILIRGLADLTIDASRRKEALDRRTFIRDKTTVKTPEQLKEEHDRYATAHSYLVAKNICTKASCQEDIHKRQSCVSYYFRGFDVLTKPDKDIEKFVNSLVAFKSAQANRKQKQQEMIGRDVNYQVNQRSLDFLTKLIGNEKWEGANHRKVSPLDLNVDDEDHIISTRQAWINGDQAIISWIQETRAIVAREGVASRNNLSPDGIAEVCQLTIKYLAMPGRGRSPKTPRPGTEGYSEAV